MLTERLTMSLRTIVSIGLLVGGAAACTSHAVDGPIDFEVSGGFTGGGDGTPALHIEPDGTATRDPGTAARKTAVLDRATMADLRAKIDDAELPILAPMYSCGCADDFVYSVTAQLDGSSHTVTADKSAEIPAELQTVIDTLKDITARPIWQ